MLFFIILVKNVLYQLPHPPLIVRMTPPLTVMNVAVNIPHLVVGKDQNQLTIIDPYRPLNTILTIHIHLQEESPEVIVSFSMCHTILLMPLLTDFIF